MSADDDLRRLLPPPRRHPGLLVVCLRWRVELLIAGCLAAGFQTLGGVVTGVLLVGLGLLVVAVPVVRRWVIAFGRTLVVTHRVRSGLVRAGVGDGRLPWLVAARARGDAVLVSVWLRAGTMQQDLHRAAPVVAAARGAAHVEVLRYSPRRDRAVLVVVRPRWGSWTR